MHRTVSNRGGRDLEVGTYLRHPIPLTRMMIPVSGLSGREHPVLWLHEELLVFINDVVGAE